MNAEGIFALSGICLLACPARTARHLAPTALALTPGGRHSHSSPQPSPPTPGPSNSLSSPTITTTSRTPFTPRPHTSRRSSPIPPPIDSSALRAFVLYAVEARIAAFSRAGWHALSLALHVAVSLLVYAFARRSQIRSMAGARAAALLFLLHGSRPEAVTWIAAQFDLWAAFFFLLALLAFEKPMVRHSRSRPLLLALLSKESAYVYPLVLLLMLWIDRVPPKRWTRLAGPSFLLTGAVFLYRWRLLGGIGGYRDIGTGRPYILTFDLLRTLKALTARLAAALDFPINWSHPLEWWLIAGLLAAMASVGGAGHAESSTGGSCCSALGFLLLAALPAHEFLLIDADLEKSRVLYLPSVGYALIFAAALEAARPRLAIGARGRHLGVPDGRARAQPENLGPRQPPRRTHLRKRSRHQWSRNATGRCEHCRRRLLSAYRLPRLHRIGCRPAAPRFATCGRIGGGPTLDLRFRIPLPHPLHKMLRRGHRRQPALPHQRPIVEQLRLLDLRQRRRRIELAAELEIHHCRFRILRIVARLRADVGDPYDARNAAAVINKDPVARFHFANRAHGLRVLHAVPCSALVALEIVDRIDLGSLFARK